MAYYRLPEKELRAYCEAVMGKYGFNEKQSRDIADILLPPRCEKRRDPPGRRAGGRA